MRIRDILRITSIPVAVASLCCLSPLILVALGLASVSFATSLADTLYGTYKWWFRGVGLLLLAVSVVLYLRRSRNICTLDEAKRRRNEIVNVVALSIVAGVVGYILFLYVVVHYPGVWLAIWE